MDEINQDLPERRDNRGAFGSSRNSEQTSLAAERLGRPVVFVDADGCRCEIIGAAIAKNLDIGYVESREKEITVNRYGRNELIVDVTIKVHLVQANGLHRSNDIESYNPYFGCVIHCFEWVDLTAVLIYREKHETIACRFGDIWPPRFVEIEDTWYINDNVLNYIGYKEKTVRRLSFPELEAMESISLAEATGLGIVFE